MKTFKAPFQSTRGALERTLLALGYVPSYGKNELGFPYVEYRHEESGAQVSFGTAHPDTPLYDGDLLRAEHSVEWWGVADLKDFYRLLREATPMEAQLAQPAYVGYDKKTAS